MRVALFTDCYFPIINGVVTLISQLREGLIAAGHEVEVVTVSYPGYRKSGDGVHRLPTLPISFGNQNFGFGLVSTGWAVKFLRDHKIDLVHSHTEFAVDDAALGAARKLGIPYIHTYHTMWEDYLHYLPRWLVGPEAVRKTYRKKLTPAAAVFAPSKKAYDYVRGLLPEAPVAIVPNGINVARFQQTVLTEESLAATRTRLGLAATDHVLLFVGRIGPEKRVRELLAGLTPLLKADASIKLVFVGDGGDAAVLRQESASEGLSGQVVLTGFIEWKDIYAIYSLATVYVTASLSEVHPMTVIEALVCGLPVVARRDDSYADQVLPGQNGELVDTDLELGTVVRDLLADATRLKSYSAKSLELSHRFTAAGHVERTLQLYQRILAAHPTKLTAAELV